jgi:hypothetical protein
VKDGSAIDAVGQPISGNVTVQKRVALDLRKSVDEPQAERSSRRQRKQGEEHSAEAEGGHPPKSYSAWG